MLITYDRRCCTESQCNSGVVGVYMLGDRPHYGSQEIYCVSVLGARLGLAGACLPCGSVAPFRLWDRETYCACVRRALLHGTHAGVDGVPGCHWR